MIKRSELASVFACHYGTEVIVGAAVAAAAAAASAAQQQAQAARQRRQAAQAAQEAKQGMPPSVGAGGSVAEAAMGNLGQLAGDQRIQSLIMPKADAVGKVAQASNEHMQAPSPTSGGAQQAFGQQPMMGDMQSAFGGQQPDYLKMMQQQSMGGFYGG